MVVILMGVSGCGKTTVGKILAEHLKLPFYDADNFHPGENVKKMSSGQPLCDDDRIPWLETLEKHISNWADGKGAVLACSALKRWYRKKMVASAEKNKVVFVYLKGSRELIASRLAKRRGHYMPAELLDSQLHTLEEPDDALVISIRPDPETIAASIEKALRPEV